MANQSPLRRWKPFLAAFDHIDAAIEAVNPALSRAEFRRVRGRIVGLLRGAAHDGDAERICRVLDGAMAEALVTLRSVPAGAVPGVLASSAGLAGAVAALRSHESELVRGLARHIVGGWKASVEDDVARLSAALEKMDDALSQQRLPPESTARRFSDGGRHSSNAPSDRDAKKKMQESKPCPAPKKIAPAVVGADRVKAAETSPPVPKQTASISHARTSSDTKASVKDSESLPKKAPPVLGDDGVTRSSPEEKVEAAKRKLHEGYKKSADAKRLRKMEVVGAPKMPPRPRKMHPIMRERSRARRESSMAVVIDKILQKV